LLFGLIATIGVLLVGVGWRRRERLGEVRDAPE
jgi:hypothetical protein